MKIRPVIVSISLLCAASFAPAQTPPDAPRSAASAPGIKPPPRLMSPEQTRDSGSTPGAVRPEQPVTPQISVPLGRTPPPGEARNARQQRASSAAGGIDDAAARCKAQEGAQARLQCEDKLSRSGSAVRSDRPARP